MHELSIAISLVDLACEEAARLPASRVAALHVQVGALSGVVKDALKFSFDVASAGTAVAGARLEVHDIPVTVWCESCGRERILATASRRRCPVCDGPTPRVLHGHELALSSLEVEMSTRIVEVRQNILRANDVLARALRERFERAGVRVISLVSSPGAGKTSLLQKTLTALMPDRRVAALVGDLATDRDAERLRQSGARVHQIITGEVCHLDARMITAALEGWDLASLEFLFLENVGNLVCPASYDLGEETRTVLMSVTEGEDKPLKYPTIFNTADLAIITKIDLADAVGFDREAAIANIRNVRPGLEILELSARTDAGMDAWLARLAGRPALQNADIQ